MVLNSKDLELDEVLKKAIDLHGSGRDSIIPILSEINDQLGYIPVSVLAKIRREINVPDEGVFLADSHLFSVASFYQMFSLQPTGEHIIRFCSSAPCHVVGGREVLEAIQEQLGIKLGETTQDKKWTLLETSCLGLCSVGPVIVIDNDIFGNVTPARVPSILARYRDA